MAGTDVRVTEGCDMASAGDITTKLGKIVAVHATWAEDPGADGAVLYVSGITGNKVAVACRTAGVAKKCYVHVYGRT